ncbi:MAG: AAA family ATPase [Ardenticatenaceae bacterium]|nr:AAA family ATPase [Anaerolineales bacterium]MCB8920447.1 AAA family ATPase [Ardenticatenaceae bacterium]MCB8989402.1 AAA family ATPase [Ardenticatenaceae bacterium]MCB9004557.1 AAA family ATPase [Ardenticatenaceae bacterium]
MITHRHLNALIELVRSRYPDWEDCQHPQFVADELDYKRATAVKAQTTLSQTELDRLIAAGEFDEFLARLERVAEDNNLLWRHIPAVGDTAVLQHPDLDKAAYCTQIRNLLYGDRPSAERLQSYSDTLAAQGLPNGWPLPTYLLFMLHPDTEMFVKPRMTQWFLRFVGETAVGATATVITPPTAALYRQIQTHAQALLAELASYGAEDMIDVQSVLWVAHREGRSRTGGLNAKGQVDLDIPPTEPLQMGESAMETAVLHETATAYEPDTNSPNHPLTLAELTVTTGWTETELARWVRAIQRKGQAVFYGPPGTGKTFIAQELARHLVGGSDGLLELVQFHPAYSYEDFMQGIRPVTTQRGLRYEMQNGRFLTFCHRAAQHTGPSVFIIDELNRANVASVFGELMYLLEYRDKAIPLAGGGQFRIPGNVRILATMNTADRSIALVDHALRRRFAFIHLTPNFDVLRHFHHQQATGFDPEPLIALLENLNAHIHDPHYFVGHSFFLSKSLAQDLPDIWRMEIEPYLEEYFYNQPDRVASYRWEHVQRHLA